MNCQTCNRPMDSSTMPYTQKARGYTVEICMRIYECPICKPEPFKFRPVADFDTGSIRWVKDGK